MEEKEKSSKISLAWSIPDELLERKDLDMYEKVLLAVMARLGALEKPVYPRHIWLAEKLGMSESGVGKTIRRLRDKGIVKYEGRKWKIAKYSITYPAGSLSPTRQADDSPTQQATHKKDIQSKDITTKVVATTSVATSTSREINRLIQLFSGVNPSYKDLFKKPPQRKALSDLMESLGKEKLEWLIKVLPQTNSMKFAPIITTPYALKQKAGDLIAFIKKELSARDKIKITKI